MLNIMELVEDKNNNNFNIKKYSDRTIYFSNSNYIEPIVFHQDNISTFSILKPESITIKDLQNYLASVNLVLIGTGEKNIILSQELIKQMHKLNKGLEFMNTESACKTHNLLLSEKRSFVSILYP